MIWYSRSTMVYDIRSQPISRKDATCGGLRMERLVDWNFEVLLRLLKAVEAKQIALGKQKWDIEPTIEKGEGGSLFDEVTDVISFPKFYVKTPPDPDFVTLPKTVETQLHHYVSAVANAFRSTPFHCVQQASQATMALTKMLSRIVVRELSEIHEEEDEESSSDSSSYSSDLAVEPTPVAVNVAAHLHNHSFAISSDPLTQFGVVLSALVHAVDHRGIPNEDLARVDPDLAAQYKGNSLTQQLSLEKAWKKLMEPSFKELRRFIYSDEEELHRFRQVLVNSVLATDIKDEELQRMRMERWEKTFRRAAIPTIDDINTRATIVIEHLMQACHIFHTISPWIVYEKWSSRQFEEMRAAFRSGRSNDDPSLCWFRNELSNFDNFVIPLAMQLKDCDAFVVGGDEYLNYALKNRQLLAIKGKGMMASLLSKINDGQLLSISQMSSPNSSKLSLKLQKDPDQISKRIQRLVNWDVEMLERMLKTVVAKRNARGERLQFNLSSLVGTCLEFTDVIEFPEFDPSSSIDKLDPDGVDLGDVVILQLRDFVSYVSFGFREDLPFHCFDHSSQKCMMTRKLLLRMANFNSDNMSEQLSLEMHIKTYGISSDPLAQLAVVIASLSKDIGHNGVMNIQSMTVVSDRAKLPKNQFEATINHLMEPKYDDLRACMFSNELDVKRFRQVFVNCVLCTDLFDDDLSMVRKNRWQKGFADSDDNIDAPDTSPKEMMDLRATIVLETVMLMSDVYHTTQNWHMYEKWNERHFEETYYYYKEAKELNQDPSLFWYKQQLINFDQHVIPTAKKMSDTCVFDSTGDELLSFALSNRQQWAAKGGDMIASMVAKYHWNEIQKIRSKKKHKRRSLSALQA